MCVAVALSENVLTKHNNDEMTRQSVQKSVLVVSER
jgi:hypothetical protein